MKNHLTDLKTRIRIRYRRFLNKTIYRSDVRLSRIENLLSMSELRERVLSHPNPINRFGGKCFSQNEEDGITLEIIRRLGIVSSGTFAEFGVDDGTENNTLVLRSLGWTGFWVGRSSIHPHLAGSSKRFLHLDEWIDLENICSLTNSAKKELGIDELDLISLDLDGNDFYFIEALLLGAVTPKVFVVEYNSKFIPPIEWKIDYNRNHRWLRDDYFGASLACLNRLFNNFGYTLICCNITGANAFFIRNGFLDLFEDVPRDIGDLYCPPIYDLKWPPHYPLSDSTLSIVAR